MGPEGQLPRQGWDELVEQRLYRMDSLLTFLTTAQALAARACEVVDVGCGRGAGVTGSQSGHSWQDLRGENRKVIGIDVDPAAAVNPVIDEFRLIGGDGLWPIGDASVDLVVCDWVLEHIEDPGLFVRELGRVLRPGGFFVARTVNRHGLLGVGARLVPEGLHERLLGRLQPGREQRDIFPTHHRMNTERSLVRLLGDQFEVAVAHRTGLEQYLLPWAGLARAVDAVERHLPQALHMTLVVVARRR